MKPTVCLNMIVKDESHIIENTLNNLLNYIPFDYWVICDTGSTDETPTIIKNFFKNRNIVGELVHHTWKDFAHNRTLALECAFNKTDYVFIFDADDSIHGSFALPTPMNSDWYMLQFGNGVNYTRPLLITNRKRWKFRGVLHEYLEAIDKMGPVVTLIGNYHVDSGRSGNRSLQPDKYYKDALVLENAYELEPPDGLKPRYAFYCGQSYKDSGYTDKAIEWYKKVLTYQHHWNQEHFYSCLQLGNLYKNKNDIPNSIYYYMKTIEYDSERMEGVVSTMEHFQKTGNHVLVNAIYHKFKNYKHQLRDKLFLNTFMFNDRIEYHNSISAFYINDKQSGYDCCKHIVLNKRLDHGDFNTTIQNLFSFYRHQLDNDKDTLQLFYEVNKLAQPWNTTIQDLWKYLFNKNRENLTLTTPSILETTARIATQSFIRSQQGLQDKILISFTTCKRLDLFKETLHSIILHWNDLDAITHWCCVDDNSSLEDRQYMMKTYPWINFYMKSDKGHCKSMNIIWDTLQTIQPKYWIHMEDDFLFYHSTNYIKPFLPILSDNNYNIKQIVYNRNYAETIDDYSIQGHTPTELPSIVMHMHPHPNPTIHYKNCHYWPHYSFRPSICLVETILQLGKFNPEATFFEREYAQRWTNANYKTGFYDGITHRHIGRLTSEIGKVKNAYDLNSESQFGTHPYIKVVNLERRPDRKQDTLLQLQPYSISPSWVTAVDGLQLDPTPALKQLFSGNDFGSKRGVIGCALSHYQLWKELIQDPVQDYYVIMEDDITLCEKFKTKLDHVLATNSTDILFLGYHMFNSKRKQVQSVYDIVTEQSTIHPLDTNLYIGGTFSYVINKSGAQKLVQYINDNGIKHGIDYVMKINPTLTLSEVHPCLVHSPWYETVTEPVDTDIQLCTTNLFEEYDQFEFFPKLDCIGNDILFQKGSITKLLQIALNNDKCVAVNTLGFFKDKTTSLTSSEFFKEKDGVFIKKNKKVNEKIKEKYRVKMLCNWCSSEQLCKEWSNMYDPKVGFEMVSSNTNIDYYVIINSTNEYYEPLKTIVFQMEPWVYKPESNWGVKTWGKWSKLDPASFLEVRGRHSNCHNNVFWQLELSYSQLENLTYQEKYNQISSICSSKYFDEGHKARIDLLQFLETKDINWLHIYNKDNSLQFINYKGQAIPYINKSIGILPYKYYFMIENNYEENFITEKLWEPILCESLCFYYGCPNVTEYIDSQAFVLLPIHDFEKCFEIMETAIREDWWLQRLPMIQKEKQKILQKLSFCPVVNEIIERDQKRK
jgi:GR25 family glycosyltransferase involved in LPS biosynthesis/tetratricopeptide (TPR) repeat protein